MQPKVFPGGCHIQTRACMHTHYEHTVRQLSMTLTHALFVVICLNNTNMQKRFACAAADNGVWVWRLQTLCSTADPPAALRRAMTHTASLFTDARKTH